MLKLLIFEVFAIICYISGTILKKPTQYPDTRIGYRSKSAIKNKQVWDFSNEFASKVFRYFSIILLIVNIVVYFSLGFEDVVIPLVVDIGGILLSICYIEFKIRSFKVEG